jgi:hypothetical protein
MVARDPPKVKVAGSSPAFVVPFCLPFCKKVGYLVSYVHEG